MIKCYFFVVLVKIKFLHGVDLISASFSFFYPYTTRRGDQRRGNLVQVSGEFELSKFDLIKQKRMNLGWTPEIGLGLSLLRVGVIPHSFTGVLL